MSVDYVAAYERPAYEYNVFVWRTRNNQKHARSCSIKSVVALNWSMTMVREITWWPGTRTIFYM